MVGLVADARAYGNNAAVSACNAALRALKQGPHSEVLLLITREEEQEQEEEEEEEEENEEQEGGNSDGPMSMTYINRCVCMCVCVSVCVRMCVCGCALWACVCYGVLGGNACVLVFVRVWVCICWLCKLLLDVWVGFYAYYA
jgi:hypothetical protein